MFQALLKNQEWSPKARSVFSMALASAIHFAGYEYARTGTITLMTSERAGFPSSSIVPFAMGCVSPFSLVLLWIYSRMLDYSGPSVALRNCTLFYAAMLTICGMFLQSIDEYLGRHDVYHKMSQASLFFLFIIENCFVQLLFTQHWAFMSSVQSREEAAVWFGPIAGIGSIASTAAAFTVAPIIDRMGLAALQLVAGVFMLLSAFFAKDAYQVAHEHGFEPAPKESEKKQIAENDGKNFFLRAIALFKRVPILGALCIEVLFSQSQSSLLNSLFVLTLKKSIPSDDDRARYTGNCYAGINGLSGLLHFAVLPVVLKRLETRHLWLMMPSVIVICATITSIQHNDNLHSVAASFLLMKVMEYSLRGVTTEMAYISLDYESRFLGKEIIGVFVNRVGKSAVAIGLSAITAYMGSQFELRYLSIALAVVAFLWLLVSYRMTSYLSMNEAIAKKDDKTKKE